jgi:hypothetical protein
MNTITPKQFENAAKLKYGKDIFIEIIRSSTRHKDYENHARGVLIGKTSYLMTHLYCEGRDKEYMVKTSLKRGDVTDLLIELRTLNQWIWRLISEVLKEDIA